MDSVVKILLIEYNMLNSFSKTTLFGCARVCTVKWLIITVEIFFLLIVSANGRTNVKELPYCLENLTPGLVLVSTIDGKFSAINSDGLLQWQIDTEPGPLLTSNIHSLELTENGKWIRLIPSLTGSLYRFDGTTIDPINISTETLLRSSFKYSDDLVMAGGVEVTTYGVGFRTGKILYTCSSLKCTNNSHSENDMEDILMIGRSAQTVRAVEPQSGNERWNFSVGYHNIKLSQISCADPHANLFNWNITAIMPDGLLLASKYHDNAETTWQYHFSSPIVRVWKWNGHKITEVDLFQIKNEKEPGDIQITPVIYLGMHKKQLYIHESYALQSKEYVDTAIVETDSLAKIPWKPISASGLLTEDDSTALSVLYSSEYVNGHGYYLYSQHDIRKKHSGLCRNNGTLKLEGLRQKSGTLLGIGALWWKELLVTLLTTIFVFNLLFRTLARHQQNREVIPADRPIKIPLEINLPPPPEPESPNDVFNSRYLNDFDTLRCLGKGGFGVVFEVKQKIDECHYAIKRIVLPNEETRREAVMREVKALAKLEHHNIVRYFNSWVEKPHFGWQQQHDSQWIKETNDPQSESIIGLNANETSTHQTEFYSKNDKTETNDSFIVFNKSCSITVSESNSENSDKIDTIDEDESHSVREIRSHNTKHFNNSPVFLYIQMQLCQKQSLKEWLIENRDRHLSHILNIFKQIVSAVEYVHMQGLIHRDLKPSNIFFSLDGQIKVGDFGLVKDEEESRTDATNVLNSLQSHTKQAGTGLYMSPEQLKGLKYNYKVDIYSLGLIFFELLVFFSTDMERIKTLNSLRENHYPSDFKKQHQDEYNLLTQMLCHLPEKRLTTFGVRARPPLRCCDSDYSEEYDFELPKFR